MFSKENPHAKPTAQRQSDKDLDTSGQAYSQVPVQMREAKRWLLWKLISNRNPTKKPNKVPFWINGAARTGELDAEIDRANLATLNQALAAKQRGDFDGLGFALGPDGTGNYWQGIDLDDVDANGLADLANSLPGYVELSPSRSGVHAFGYGAWFPALGSNGTGIEAYCERRFFTVTGHSLRSSI